MSYTQRMRISYWSTALDAANLIGWRYLAHECAEQLILAMGEVDL